MSTPMWSAKQTREIAVKQFPRKANKGMSDPIKKYSDDVITQDQINQEKQRIQETYQDLETLLKNILKVEKMNMFSDDQDDVIVDDQVQSQVIINGPILPLTSPGPSRMTYFEPLGSNVQGFDELQFGYIPFVSEETDYRRVCAKVNDIYPNSFHGHRRNTFEISEQVLFELMMKLLPTTTNPDLLYYCLYLFFPNEGTQEQFSQKFPILARKWAKNEDELEELLRLEPWKTDEEKEEKKLKPINYRNPCSTHNFFCKTIKLPDGNAQGYCSENCYHSIQNLGELLKDLRADKDMIKIFIRKSTEIELDFLNRLVLRNEIALVKNFCSIAKEFDEKTCLDWFKFVLDMAEQPDDVGLERSSEAGNIGTRLEAFKKFKRSETVKLERKQEKQLKEEAKVSKHSLKNLRAMQGPAFATVVDVTPCCHIGPCGSTNPLCSCKVMCTDYCQCNVLCNRRFPGCNCKPGSCGTERCPCYQIGWECLESTCGKCVHSGKLSCQNSSLTLGEMKKVEAKKSAIAGNGLFIEEDVEKDDLIAEYFGERITEEETERRGLLGPLIGNYIFNLPGRQGSLDSFRTGNCIRFINHSRDEANCIASYKVVKGTVRIGMYATTRIQKGKELFFDYGYDDFSINQLFLTAPKDRVPKIDKRQRVVKRENMLETEDGPVRKQFKTRSGRESSRFVMSHNAILLSTPPANQPSTSSFNPSTPATSSGQQDSSGSTTNSQNTQTSGLVKDEIRKCTGAVHEFQLAHGRMDGNRWLESSISNELKSKCEDAMNCLHLLDHCAVYEDDDILWLEDFCDSYDFLTGGFHECALKIDKNQKDPCVQHYLVNSPYFKFNTSAQRCEMLKSDGSCVKSLIDSTCSPSSANDFQGLLDRQMIRMKC